MNASYMLGVADTLTANGFVKEAADIYISVLVPATEKTAAVGDNPFSSMSDQEIIQLIESLPAPLKAEIAKQLQEHAAVTGG